MASKTSTVVLPAVFCLVAWWRGELWRTRNGAVLIPALLLALAACALSLWTQQIALAGYHDAHWVRTWPERIATAGDAIWFYLGKLLWPQPLMAVYPRWQIDGGNPLSYLQLLFVLGALFLFCLKRDGWGRPWFFAFAYFIGVLLPVLGLADQTIFRYSFVYNHFQYLPSMGPIALVSAGLTLAAGRISFLQIFWPRAVLTSVLLLALGALSSMRSWVYANDETLWLDSVAQNPSCWGGQL